MFEWNTDVLRMYSAGGHTNRWVLQSDISSSGKVEQLVDDLAIGAFIRVYS